MGGDCGLYVVRTDESSRGRVVVAGFEVVKVGLRVVVVATIAVRVEVGWVRVVSTVYQLPLPVVDLVIAKGVVYLGTLYTAQLPYRVCFSFVFLLFMLLLCCLCQYQYA